MAAPEATPHRAPLVVIAVGNRSRGDDALGPLLLDRLAAHLGQARGAGVELIEDFQLQVEHALDLDGRELALFIDAGTGTPAPYAFAEVAASPPSAGHSTHALAPQQVLGCYRQVMAGTPPPAFVLCVRGERFELGEDPSAEALGHLEAAWPHLRALCEDADVERWRRSAAPKARA